MKLYAPKYYKDFKCIADKCTHSCCIGWEIDVDSDTYRKYVRLNHEYKTALLDSIDITDAPHFKLGDGERCPHLDGQGLCKIITHLGKDYLCEICREHPRFYLDSEMGIGMACEEACRIILSSDEYDIFEKTPVECDALESNPQSLVARDKIFSILKNDKLSHEEKLYLIQAEYGVYPEKAGDEEINALLWSLEYLDEDHRELFSHFSVQLKTPAHLEKQLERALAYFVFRHCTVARDQDDFRAALGFALICERLICYAATKLDNAELAARIISEELEYSQENTEKIMLLFSE